MKRLTRYLLIALSFAVIAGCTTMGGDNSTIDGVSSTIMFQNDSTTLDMAGKSTVSKLADYLKNNKGKIVIEGHTDTNGSAKYNEALSMKRAEAVKAALLRHNVDPKRITTKAYGLTKPIVKDAKTAAEHAKNRRAVVTLYKRWSACK